MGLDYVFFHCTYTVPLATILSVFYSPFLIRQETYKISLIIAIAIVATIPWDSYLIRHHIWSYSSDTVTGYTFCSIPLEEVFFFAIQTYLTSLLYCVFTKPLVLPIYLRQSLDPRVVRDAMQAFLVTGFATGIACCYSGGRLTYLGLILIWVCPILLLQWSLSHSFLTALPWKATVIPVLLSTLYLWVADASAVRVGTWVIEDDTKLGHQLWNGLELEEAFFFLVTNLMVVGGLASIDYGIAIEECKVLCSEKSPPPKFSFIRALRSAIQQLPKFDACILDQLSRAVLCLQRKSQSMFLGSAVFQGNLRTDLIFLYYFCRIMDDLVDGSDNNAGYDAEYWLTHCSRALDVKLSGSSDRVRSHDPSKTMIASNFKDLHFSIDLLPMARLSKQPLYDLLRGFEMDLSFNAKMSDFPIRTETDLDLYASRVAGTIATLTLDLVYHNELRFSLSHSEKVKQAGMEMGKALQCVNIARDIGRDAAIQRVYIPTSWLSAVGLTPLQVIQCPTSAKVHLMQQKMLDHADYYYSKSRPFIEELPTGIREPIRATVESYFAIGKALRLTSEISCDGNKFRLPLWRRLMVAWLAMRGGYLQP